MWEPKICIGDAVMNKIYMIPAISLPPHSQYGTMGKLPNCSEPQLFDLQGGTDICHIGLLWDLNELGFIKHPQPHLTSASRVVGEGNAPHSSTLAWRIPGTGEPGGLPSVGSHSRTRLKRLSSSSSRVVNSESYSVEEQVLDYLWALWIWVEDRSFSPGGQAQQLC